MERLKKGFTLIEVMLFLAITALIFVGIVMGMQNSIFQQRYNDAVQSFAEFLRNTYSQVNNVQSNGDGRSNEAIYGKLVVFGEDGNGENEITSYNVIGDIEGSNSGDGGGGSDECSDGDKWENTLEKLCKLGMEVGDKGGYVEDYQPRWGSQIQTASGWGEGYELFTGILLIVRDPVSGVVNTYFSNDEEIVGKINDDLKDNSGNGIGPIVVDEFDPENKRQLAEFCVNPNGASESSLRRKIEIEEKARNASGVIIVPDDNNGCR